MVKKQYELEYSYEGAVSLAADANYDFETALYELVDNSFGAGANNVTVKIYTNSNDLVTYLEVEDDGSGMKASDIPIAFAPGGKKGTGMNEHGAGMKAAIQHLGSLNAFHSYLGKDGDWFIEELNPDANDGKIVVEENLDPTDKVGASIVITCDHSKAKYTKKYKSSAATSLKCKLGHKYAMILDKPNKSLTLEYRKEDPAMTDPAYLKRRHSIDAWHSSNTAHLLIGHEITGKNNDFKVSLDIYKLVEKKNSNNYDPIKATTGSAGLDVVKDDRVVVARSKSPLAKVKSDNGKTPFNFNHPSQNRLYGRITIHHGIATTPKKDNIQENTNAFQELQELVAEVWEKENIKSHFAKPEEEEIQEKVIEENLMVMLEEDSRGYEDIQHQVSTHFGTKLDVRATLDAETIIFEVKRDQGYPRDVNQLLGYLISLDEKKGVLVCHGITDNAVNFMEKCNALGYNLSVWDTTKMAYGGLRKVE